MQCEPSLEQLMASYQGGDFPAAHALIVRASPPLYRFLASWTVHQREADDLLQETWLRIHTARHTYRSGEPVMPWLFAIARRTRIDHYRRFRRVAAREEPMGDTLSTAAVTDPAEGNTDIAALLARLTPAEREVLELMKIGGLSLEEVARVTSTTVGAVKQRVHRAYKKLRSPLKLPNQTRGGTVL